MKREDYQKGKDGEDTESKYRRKTKQKQKQKVTLKERYRLRCYTKYTRDGTTE